MKKILSLLLVLILTLRPVAALAGNWYTEKGIILAERMHALASDKIYITTFSTADDLIAHIGTLAKSDFSAPVEARMLNLPDEEAAAVLMSLLSMASDGNMPQLSETAKSEIFRRLPGTFISSINGQFGVTMVAASSILSTSESYITPEGFQPGVLLLQYPGEYSVAVAFSQSGEETVSASAMPIYTEFITELTARDDLSLLERVGLNLLFKEIKLS